MSKIKEILAITICALAFMLITGIAKANPITTWITNEKNKIVEYQTKSWQSAKEQNVKTKESIVNLFTKVKNSVTQD